MNFYIVRSLFVEVKESIQRVCSCSGNNCSKICAASGTAVILPIASVLQLFAIAADQWAMEPCHNCTLFHGFGCWLFDHKSSYLCILEVLSCVAVCLLSVTGCGVCCRTCYRSLTIESCSFCYVCILSLLSLLPGIFSWCCCVITLHFMQSHPKLQLSLHFSWYVYATTGSATILISMASTCGYTCMRSCRFRQYYDTQIGSDDDDREENALMKN